MVRETTDANANYGNKEIEDGNWDFRLKSISVKMVGTNKDTKAYILKVSYAKGDGEQILLPSMIGPLLRVFGAKEDAPNIFSWDTEDYDGQSFNATVTHEADKKEPEKIRQKMGKFQPPMAKKTEDIPF